MPNRMSVRNFRSIFSLRALRAGALMFAPVCMLMACARVPVVQSRPEPTPTQVSISLSASAQVNVDARGRPTPVVVRTYVLKNASAFEAADFFSLFDRDRQVLGDALLLREELVLKPGEARTLDVMEIEGGKVVAVLVAFREVDRAVWRAIIPVVANRTNRIAANLQDNRVTLVASVANPAFPAVFAVPSAPSVPSVPSMPSLPSAPSMPSVPSVPSMPSVPSVPSVPSMPSVIWNP